LFIIEFLKGVIGYMGLWSIENVWLCHKYGDVEFNQQYKTDIFVGFYQAFICKGHV
jgi:hypothetical protein